MDARTLGLLDEALARVRAILEPQGFLFGSPRLLDEGSWGRYDISIDPPSGGAGKLQVHINGKGRTSVVPQGACASAMKRILDGGSVATPSSAPGAPAPSVRALPLTRAAREAQGTTAAVAPSTRAPRDAEATGAGNENASNPSTTTGRAGAPVPGESLVVDCSKFGARLIGPTEWRGMQRNDAGGWTEVFRSARHERGHNNLGEFLAIIDALRRIEAGTLAAREVFSDSRTAISWVTKGRVKTTLDVSGDCDAAFAGLVREAQQWITTSACARLRGLVKFWNTSAAGENPADFGRK